MSRFRSPASIVLLAAALLILPSPAAIGAEAESAAEAGPTLARFDEALARAAAANKVVVLDFFTDW